MVCFYLWHIEYDTSSCSLPFGTLVYVLCTTMRLFAGHYWYISLLAYQKNGIWYMHIWLLVSACAYHVVFMSYIFVYVIHLRVLSNNFLPELSIRNQNFIEALKLSILIGRQWPPRRLSLIHLVFPVSLAQIRMTSVSSPAPRLPIVFPLGFSKLDRILLCLSSIISLI